jgi:hypothetical protein
MCVVTEENACAQVNDDPHFLLDVVNIYLPSDDIVVCIKCTASGSSKHTDKQSVIPQINPSTIVGLVPPPVGVIGLTIRSTTEAWDSSRHLTEFLEGFKNAEADRGGTHFPFTTSTL